PCGSPWLDQGMPTWTPSTWPSGWGGASEPGSVIWKYPESSKDVAAAAHALRRLRACHPKPGLFALCRVTPWRYRLSEAGVAPALRYDRTFHPTTLVDGERSRAGPRSFQRTLPCSRTRTVCLRRMVSTATWTGPAAPV